MAASVVAVSSTGDVVFLGALLGLAAADVLVGTTAALAVIAVIGRWGSTSMAAVAGGQAVIGPAGWTGSTALVLSAWAAALALVAASPRHPVAIVAFGVSAGAMVAGPAVVDGGSSAGDLSIRVAAAALLVVACWLSARFAPSWLARPVALALAAGAAGATLLA